MHCRHYKFELAALVAAFGGLSPMSRATDIPITEDSYLDSTYSVKSAIVVANTQTINFDTYTGTSGSSQTPSNQRVKVVSSNGSTQFPGNSKVRGLIKLPQGFWDAFDTGTLLSATVSFHIFNNSLNTGNYPDARDVELHPMTHAWDTQTSTWRTYDATHPWSTTDTTSDHDDPGTGGGGGDFDAARFVNTINPNVASGGIISWDITSFLTDSTAMSELRANGALLKSTNETNFEGNRFYSLYSYNAGGSNGPFVTVPEPSIMMLAVFSICPLLRRRESRRLSSSTKHCESDALTG